MSLYDKTIRLAYENPELREKLLPLVKQAGLSLRKVKSLMRRHNIPGEVSGRGSEWEVELPDEAAKKLFERHVSDSVGGYRTGFGGWVLRPGYQGSGDWNDPSSRHHYANQDKTAGIERELLEGVVSMRELGKVRSTLRKAGDRQSLDLVSEVVQAFLDKFSLSSNEEAALRRLSNLPHGSQDPASLRNQVFKIANLMGMRLPSAMFASEGKTARRALEYDYENGEVGVIAGQSYGYSYNIRVYWPLSNTNRRGKRVNVRDVRIDNGSSNIAWAHTFLDMVKGAKSGAQANRILDKLVKDAEKLKEDGGVTEIYEYDRELKGVDPSLPTPEIHKVKDIRGKDITVDLNAKPIRLYSKSHAESLDQGRQVYWFKIPHRYKEKLMALAPELEAARNIREAEKILSANKIRYDHHIYMDPMWQ